jgi:hypothetical protein
MKISKYAIAILFMGLALTSCNDDDDTTETPTGGDETSSMIVEFDHVWGPSEAHFHLGDDFVQPDNGDTLNFTMFRYYISNIMLHGTDGTLYMEPESYHIVDLNHMIMSNEITLTDVPTGSYSGITFTIGVDSLRNVSGAQTGALDPANQMFWNWNSGYIFVKAEGATSSDVNSNFTYHLGGFMGPNSALNTLDFSFNGSYLDVESGSLPTTHIVVRTDKIWDANFTTSTAGSIQMPNANAALAAGNFANGFRFDHNHN